MTDICLDPESLEASRLALTSSILEDVKLKTNMNIYNVISPGEINRETRRITQSNADRPHPLLKPMAVRAACWTKGN